MDFVAIDFETANYNRASACSVGLVVVKDYKVKETFSSLIRPVGDFEERFVKKHGITSEDVNNSPSFQEIYPEIIEIVGDKPLVAHNAPFDVGVIKENLLQENLPIPNLDYFCTLSLSRRLLPGLPNHQLGTVARLFGIDLLHHDANSDAYACAIIAINLIRMVTVEKLDGYVQTFMSHDFGNNNTDDSMISSISISELELKSTSPSNSLVKIAEPDDRFNDLKFVFTGELDYMGREEAEDVVKFQGGRVIGSVSKKTNYIVVGAEELRKYKETGLSATNKLKKAFELRDNGVDIEILNESEFIQMIG